MFIDEDPGEISYDQWSMVPEEVENSELRTIYEKMNWKLEGFILRDGEKHGIRSR